MIRAESSFILAGNITMPTFCASPHSERVAETERHTKCRHDAADPGPGGCHDAQCRGALCAQGADSGVGYPIIAALARLERSSTGPGCAAWAVSALLKACAAPRALLVRLRLCSPGVRCLRSAGAAR